MTNEKLTNRQAIGVLDVLWSNPLFGEVHRQAFEISIKAIKALEQEPKTGYWIAHQEGKWIYAKCSKCNAIYDVKTNYCPNCGRQMGGKP